MAATRAPPPSPVLGPPRRDIGVDLAFLHRRKVGVGAIARVRRQLRRLLAQIGFDGVGDRRQLMLIALLRVEAVGDDHLRRRVDRRLRIVALDEAVLGFHDAAFGIGEVLLRFGVRLFGWRAGGPAGFLAALGLSPLLGLGLRFGLGRRGRFRLGLAARIFSARFFLSATHLGSSSPL